MGAKECPVWVLCLSGRKVPNCQAGQMWCKEVSIIFYIFLPYPARNVPVPTRSSRSLFDLCLIQIMPVWIVKLNWNSWFANLCWAFQNWCQAVPRRPKIRHRPTPQPTPQPGPLTRLTCRTLLMRRMRIPCHSPKRPTRRKKKSRLRCNLHSSSCQAGPRLPGKFLQRIAAASTSFRRFCGSVPVHNLLRSGSSLAPC